MDSLIDCACKMNSGFFEKGHLYTSMIYSHQIKPQILWNVNKYMFLSDFAGIFKCFNSLNIFKYIFIFFQFRN